MKIPCQEFLTYLHDNRMAITTMGGLAITAAVKVMPHPDVKWFSVLTIKAFIYDFSHQFFNTTPKLPEGDPK